MKASEILNKNLLFFRKKTGEYVYKTLSEPSVKHYGLDVNYLYGVCGNGNVTKVKLDTEVEPCTLGDFIDHIHNLGEFDRTFAKSEFDKTF